MASQSIQYPGDLTVLNNSLPQDDAIASSHPGLTPIVYGVGFIITGILGHNNTEYAQNDKCRGAAEAL